MIIYLGYIYLLFGAILLSIPLIYIELGRPKDFIKAGLNFVIGMILIVKDRTYNNFYSSILVFITILFTFYIVEIFSVRWNQLTIQEKNKLKTFVEFKKNLSKFLEAISLLFKKNLNLNNIFKVNKNNKNLIKKKWVTNENNGNILTYIKNKLLTLEMPKKATIQSKEDIIEKKKNI